MRDVAIRTSVSISGDTNALLLVSGHESENRQIIITFRNAVSHELLNRAFNIQFGNRQFFDSRSMKITMRNVHGWFW